MKTADEIERVLQNPIMPTDGKTNYSAMTYEQGIKEALCWVLGDISDEEFSYS